MKRNFQMNMTNVSETGVASQQLVDAVQLAMAHQLVQDPDGESSNSQEPLAKRPRTEELDISPEQSIKQILFNINKAICLRLDSIEKTVETVCLRTKSLEDKVEVMYNQLRHHQGVTVVTPSTPGKTGMTTNKPNGAVIVGLPQERPGDTSSGSISSLDQSPIHSFGPNVTLITLNTEEDYPTGCWLGDESNPEMRVRVPITTADLLHVHSNCRTPEKMALTLLDYLFDRDTQAMSNLSGMGKHGKKQLDPLMIYGIRCHLIQRFALSEQDWHRIKQNLDSKCRTAFRRRTKGLPLTVKAFRGKAPPTYLHMNENSMQQLNSDDSMTAEDAELTIAQEGVESDTHNIIHTHNAADILHTAGGGEIQVLHATAEQVAQLQQSHQIQILQGGQVLLQQGDGQEPIHVQVSLAQSDGIQVMTTDEGDHMSMSTVHHQVETQDVDVDQGSPQVIKTDPSED